MTNTYSLAAEKRTNSKHSARETRVANRIPATLYGHNVDAKSVSVDYSEFLKLFRKAGQSSLVDLEVDGKKEKVLVYSYDLDPVRDTFIHVDFFVVNLKEITTVHVPLIFEGESGAVKNLGGVFMSAHTELVIRCLPTDIPHDLVVDISGMENLRDNVMLKDLNLDSKFEIMNMEENTVLCSITEHSIVVDEDPVETPVEGEEGEEEGAEEGKAESGE